MSVRLDIAGHIARVTIDRPDVMNALDITSDNALEAIWRQIEADPAVRAVVLTGTGERAFCVGSDMKNVEKSGLEYWAGGNPNGFGGIALRTTLDVPVIARVNGHALGGGFEMVLGCDIIIAAEEATFGLPEPRVGRLPLDGGMVLLQRQIPHHLAMGMLLTGRRAKAAELKSLGLVNEVVPRADLDAAVERWLADILACAPLSLRAIKQTIRRTAHLTAREAREQRLPALMTCLASNDGAEGVRAFREKRSPVWTGT